MSHIGCFVDGRRRDLPTLAGKGSMTVGRCYGLCKKKGFRFFGVQIGKQCWCGNHYGRYGRRDKRECRYQCRGDKTTYCGGAWRNNVYATGVVVASKAAGVKYVGCFKDNRYRDLPVVYTANYKTTKAYCFRYCRAKGYRYFGLQNGNACTCGNTVGRYGKAKSKDCARSTCKGDKRSKCGGPWRNSVFTTGLKPKSFKTPGMSHIGCFVDGRRRDLPTVGGKGSITVGRCYGLCKKKGFRFFGVQIGKQCWCGNHYGRYGRRDKRECRYQCRGDKTTYCGGSWRNDVYATGLEEHASGVTLLGCFRDNSKRDLPLVHGAGHRTTKAYCLKYCKSRGYRYFGLQAGSACTCGNKYGSFGRVNAKQCRTRCRGDKRRTCGGSWRNSVYSTGIGSKPVRLPGLKHLGCYLDKSSRDLRKLVLSGSVTVPKCYKACKARKYRFFGVQNGYQCWCGNHYGRYRIRSNLECRVQCRGDKSTYCGGAWRNNVFTTGYNPKASVKTCPSGSKAKTVKRLVCGCAPASGSQRLGSLVIVVDTTGSMSSVYKSVRRSISRILSANRRFQNFVVSSYGDPYKRHVIRTKSISRVQRFLNGLKIRGGGDCPEYSMSAVIDAAKLADKDSVLLLFTDASAKDRSLTSSAAKLLKSKRIRFIAIGSGRLCGRGAEYDVLAKNTGGLVAKLNRRVSDKVMKLIELAAKGKMSFSAFPKNTRDLANALRGKCPCRTVTRHICAMPHSASLGCFLDDPKYPDFSVVAGRGKMTVWKCNNLCKAKKFSYFGLKNGSKCSCGDNYGNSGGAKESKCNKRCSGNSKDKCGGTATNSVYKVD
ncbi:hypothetical protein BOX15_Mlig000253g1 [Macrostomum lignano]|uniref:WSC domain-containing protein n=1 Tax=Macrostomum lignano TaxID=282301 RepID=A0A267F9U1_9PLAT|nr:hypothetical protein BOX15_Mlig000253g1 [Macrostomum lignano]